ADHRPRHVPGADGAAGPGRRRPGRGDGGRRFLPRLPGPGEAARLARGRGDRLTATRGPQQAARGPVASGACSIANTRTSKGGTLPVSVTRAPARVHATGVSMTYSRAAETAPETGAVIVPVHGVAELLMMVVISRPRAAAKRYWAPGP